MFFPNSTFKVHSLIGEGLNAKVYRVTETSKEFKFQQAYALKVLKRVEDVRLFKKEFETLTSVEGKHLVKLLGWRKYKSKPALLLEYIEGVNLLELVTECGPLSQQESNWLFQEIQQGLNELKDSGLFHGDLSPKNIMIGHKGEVKLIDFGLSRWKTQNIQVTPEFASPEVFTCKTPTYEHDLYALKKIFKAFKLPKPQKASQNFDHIVSQYHKCPITLADKVSSLIFSNSVTKDFHHKNKKKKKKKNKINNASTPQVIALQFIKRNILFPVCGVFFLPISVDNIYKKETKTFIRSSSWLAVKSDTNSKGWCFTPCTLNFKHLGPNTIYWKTKNSKGYTKVFIESDGQTLVLTP